MDCDEVFLEARKCGFVYFVVAAGAEVLVKSLIKSSTLLGRGSLLPKIALPLFLNLSVFFPFAIFLFEAPDQFVRQGFKILGRWAFGIILQNRFTKYRTLLQFYSLFYFGLENKATMSFPERGFHLPLEHQVSPINMIYDNAKDFKFGIEIFTGFIDRFEEVIQRGQGVWRRLYGDQYIIGGV
jgi:hypothetical protein